MIKITSKVKASKMQAGSFIDIPTKFVKSPQDKQRTIHIKEDGSSYYSYNPYGHRKHLYMIEIRAKEGYYLISEQTHKNIKRIEKYGEAKSIDLKFEICEYCTVEPKVKDKKYCISCGEFADRYYMDCAVEDVDKPLPSIPKPPFN